MATRSSLAGAQCQPHSARCLCFLCPFEPFPVAVLLLAVLLLGFADSRCVRAQTSYGTVVGTVTDSTLANVLGATVTLKNDGTDAAEVTRTGNGGTYSFINLNPGSYSLTVAVTFRDKWRGFFGAICR